MLAGDDDVEREVALSDLSTKLKKCLSVLKDRRRRYIVEHVFGVNGKKEMTYGELGKKYGISKQRVEQLLKDSLKRLKDYPVAMTLMEELCNV
jgi:RNA polymerase sigma factor (sigma-70 family)